MYDPAMRVLTVLELLQARERVSGPELARVLEVSPRTVQRYVARLQDLGIPVEASRGPGGAYRLRPGFRLPPLMFSEDEALALSLGLLSLRELGLQSFAPAARSATDKLRRVLPEGVRARVTQVQAAVRLHPNSWTVAVEAEALSGLAAAVHGGLTVAFHYRRHDAQHSLRTVDPYGLVHLDGRWYLVGRCHDRQALRSFRLDRVAEVSFSGGHFEAPPGFDASAHLHANLPFAQQRYAVEVWLDAPPEGLQTWLTPNRFALQALQGGTLLRCTRDDLTPLAATLLGLDCEIEVREPPELRAVMAGLAARAARAAGPAPRDRPADDPRRLSEPG